MDQSYFYNMYLRGKSSIIKFEFKPTYVSLCSSYFTYQLHCSFHVSQILTSCASYCRGLAGQRLRSVLKGTIPILRQLKDWVGGSRKWPVLLTFITVFMLTRWVVGVQKGHKYADVIQGWPLTLKSVFFYAVTLTKVTI